MKVVFKILFIVSIMTVLGYSAPARGGIIEFQQPDGSKFSGMLRGDASFHWIESNAEIVLLNPKDNFYYKAQVAEDGTIELSDIKMMQESSLKRDVSSHRVPEVLHQALMQKLQESKRGNYPR